MLYHTLYSAPTTHPERKKSLKRSLKKFYDCKLGNGIVRCMLDMGLPSSVVIASHLFRRANQHIAPDLLGIEDIDCDKNGLLLFKPIEKAYDDFHLGFIKNGEGELVCKVFNRNILTVLLYDNLTEDQKNDMIKSHLLPSDWRTGIEPIYATGTTFNLRTTYGDLDGRPLAFKNLNRPYHRCLSFQARLALCKAREKNWIEDTFDFEDFLSEGMSVKDKVEWALSRTFSTGEQSMEQ